jgi:hypothetical protein
MGCPSCGRGMHQFCLKSDCEICHSVEVKENNNGTEELSSEDNWRYKAGRSNRGAGKRDDSLRDQQSTGRKRAAIKYPLDRDSSCEWRGLLYAGGADFPIVGCLNGKQQARHHGPDKNTLNNDEGNVHRICHACHNRWHSRNDDGYTWGGIYRPHDPNTKATTEEFWAAEQKWLGVKLKKVSD